MNKGIVALISIILLITLIGGICIHMINNNLDNEIIETDNAKDVTTNSENTDNNAENNNILILYFSATNNTETIAKYIAELTNGYLVEIIPVEEYTSEDLDYNNSNSRANLEQNDDNARPEIANTNIDISSYDTIYLGYPIWWGDVPKIILTLLDTYDFSLKTIIPFCTSASTGIETSVNTLKNYNKNVNFLDGKRFASTATLEDVKNWLNEHYLLKLFF